jgi:putative intracellular protease/amidase
MINEGGWLSLPPPARRVTAWPAFLLRAQAGVASGVSAYVRWQVEIVVSDAAIASSDAYALAFWGIRTE